jgi:hypothetical protein
MRLIPIVSHGPCDLTVAAAGHQQSMKYGFLGASPGLLRLFLRVQLIQVSASEFASHSRK